LSVLSEYQLVEIALVLVSQAHSPLSKGDLLFVGCCIHIG
jgi:hypothetical protein